MPDFEDDSSLLAVLLDVSPAALAYLSTAPGLSLQSLLEQLLTFVNAFTLLNDGNQLAVFAAGSAACHLAYCSPSCVPRPAGVEPAPPPRGPPSVAVLEGLQAAAAAAGGGAGGCCQLSSALSRALCFINGQQRRAAAAAGAGGDAGGAAGGGARRQLPARLLCLSAAPDVPSQYISAMNAIFSAQRSGVLVDACQLGRDHSSFLQQAAHLTGGAYLKPAHPQALLQYLNSVFALDAATRALLRLPASARVDFRATCFCHKRRIDLGYVCSACLSIFCQQLPACTTCGTDFLAASKQ